MGRVVVIGIFVVIAIMGSVIYWTFKQHDYFASEVSSRLKEHFSEHLVAAKDLPSHPLAGTIFRVQDTVLLVIVPPLIESAPSVEKTEAARLQISQFVTAWLQTELKKASELQVQVKFQGEL